MTLKELHQQRGELATKIRGMADTFNQADSRWEDAETEGAWRQLNAEYDGVMAQIEAAADVQQGLTRVENDDNRRYGIPGHDGTRPPQHNLVPSDGDRLTMDQKRSLALAGWCRAQMGGRLTEDMEMAARETGISPYARELRFATPNTQCLRGLYAQWRDTHPNARRPEDFRNAAMSTSDTAGGDLIPPETLIRSLEVNMLRFGGMREVSQILTTSSGETISWPTFDDTGNSGRLVAESTVVDDNAGGGSTGDGGPNPTTGDVQWGAYKYTSDTVLVPFELLEDSVFDLAEILGEALGERLGRITNAQFTTGTGSSQPKGIVTAATLGVTAASQTAFTADNVYELQHSVDPAYRNGGRFMCHDSIALFIRKLKDGDSRYLWQSGFNTGVPDSLAGSPMTINQSMAGTLATDAKVLLYGDLYKYKIRRVNGVRLYRLEERYRERDQDGFVAFVREDGNLLEAGTPPVKYLKLAAAATTTTT